MLSAKLDSVKSERKLIALFMFVVYSLFLMQCTFFLSDAQCVNERDMFGRTALMYAVHFGHLDSIQVLLENNSDINARTGGTFILWQ